MRHERPMLAIQMARDMRKKIIMEQKGQALVAVLILLAIGGLLMVPTLGYVSTSLKAHQVSETKTMELYAADSGVEDAIYWLIQGKPQGGDWSWNGSTGERISYVRNDCIVNVSLEVLPEANNYKISSLATSSRGSTKVLSLVWAITWFQGDHNFSNTNPPPEGDIHVEGDVSFSNNVQFTGDLTCSGSVTTMNNAVITGRIWASGDVVMENNSEIHGTLCSGGDITLGNGCVLTGEIRLWNGGTISIVEAGAYVDANVWVDGNLSLDIQYGSAARTELIGCVYAPSGDVSVYLRKKDSEIQGDIYAGGFIQILDDTGTHIGTQYPSYTGSAPILEPDCPQPPSDPTDIKTYEIM
jgi:predicted acyltransferase (DUF342 family)/uncharacterized protein (UPF0333 family)